MDISAIKAITDGSGTLTAWSINLLGGSLLAILSTSYVKPIKGIAKYMYVLFLPGWVLLALTIKSGDEIVRSGIMAYLNPNLMIDVVIKINGIYNDQLNYFFYALCCFCLWLVCYLTWWLFTPDQTINNSK